MPNPTLRQIVDTFTENELDLTVPIDFQDVNATDFPIVKQYNTYLADGNYNAALRYRNENINTLDKYIFDAKKINILQSLAINAYLFAKGEKSAVNTSYDNTKSGCSAANVQGALDECFQSVSNGKALIASAITDKKIFTGANASFKQMAANIRKIVLGSGNATAANVLAGKTFTNDDGIKYTGTMTNHGEVIHTLAAGETYMIPAGYHNGGGKVTANTLAAQTSATATAAGIQSGKTAWVNGVKITGTAKIAPSSLNGTVYLGKCSWNVMATFSVTFSTPFSSVPTVQVSSNNKGENGCSITSEDIGVTSVTKAGFTGWITVPGTIHLGYSDIYVNWTAVV